MYLTKTEGIIIKNYDYGEGHRIVVLFTEALGKVKAVAKGSRKIKSRFGAALEPLSENHFMLYRKPASPLYTLTSCKIINAHSKLREDMRLFGYASMMAEGVDLLTAEEEREENIYRFFRQALYDVEYNDAPSAAWLFMFRLLKYAGYRLNLFNCTACGKKSLNRMYFSLETGGVFCSACLDENLAAWPVAANTIKNIRELSPQGVLERQAEEEISNIIKKFIKYQFSCDLKSLKFLNLFTRKGTEINSKREIMKA